MLKTSCHTLFSKILVGNFTLCSNSTLNMIPHIYIPLCISQHSLAHSICPVDIVALSIGLTDSPE
eukprot:gnl/Chilomastix_caulleri/5600.p1 GENE.gnl/Chilomastix_caulleri/5600~~gnl/Chilomastix_caulleri/5600.p1  ORF type:complete len:65 (-),score=0.75 gnl/Chilomastix_caulleri/5600:25-219(-)